MSQDNYFNASQSKLIKDWLEDDIKEHKIETKKKEWKFKFSGVIYLYVLVGICIIYAIISNL